ncbi:MAG TPA: PAS domain S-box protein, partial [Methanoregula sp.]|nr:PAS domain S-box protein [Methanoregula sp.]
QAVKRKEAERSLQESEKRLSDIINFLPDATFAIDRSGHVIAWNRAIEDMTGVTAADMLGKGEHEYAVPFYGVRRPILIDLIFEPDNIIRERYAHIIHEKDILIADTTLPRPKGKAVTLMGKASPLYNRQGKVVGAIESIRDITDLKKAEHDLQRSEEWFRNLIQNSSDMIRIIGKDGRISYSSPSTRRILGYDRSALIGKDPFEFIHPDDREHARQAFAEVVKNTNPHSPTEYRLRHADGYYVDVEAVANNLLDVPDIDGVVVTVRPITERKRAEAALRESEEKFRGMADRISDIVLIVDKDFRLTYISPSFLKMTNRDASELLGKPLPITQLTPSEQEKVEAAFRDNQDLKTTGPLEISYTIPGRGPIILEFHGVPIQEGGVFFGVQLLAHDITNLRKTQDKLRSAYEHLAAVEQDLRRQYDEIAKSRQDLAESEKQYKTLFEGANDAILIGDRTTILNCNHSTEVLFGCSRDQIINHPITNFFTERQPDGQLSKEKASEKINATLAGKPQSFEWVQLRQDRTPVYVEVSLNRILIRGVYYVQGIVRDITERRKADVALRESESKFSLVFRNSPVALTLVSATDGVFVDVNDAFLRNTRYSREEVMGKTAKDLKLIPGQENRGRIDSALRSQQEIHGMEISCRIKTGEIRSCLISSSKIVMHGEPHILSTIEDITERKATEFAVQAMVRSIVGTTGLPSLRQITENVSSWLGADCVMIGEIHEDGRTVKVLSMLLDGKEVSGHIYPIKGTPFGNTVETGFCLFQDDIRNIFPGCKALDELTIRAYVGTPLRNSAGRVSGILCALSRNPLKSTLSLQEIIDIIAVKAAAEIESMQMTRALRESEQKFRSLVEYSLEGILILDFQGTILFANNSIARMLELHDCTGLMGRNVMEFVAPESRNDAMRDFGEVARGHDAYLAQYKVITAQGNEIYIESIGKIIGYEGKTADLVSIHEVTERKKAEDALSRSQHMLAEAMDLAHLVNWEYDVASGLFTFDDRFYALYGTTAE